MSSTIHISGTKSAWVDHAANSIIQLSKRSIEERGEFSLVLSGGGTPAPIYTALSERSSELEWEHTFLFWGDERCVPSNHPDSNYKLVQDTLINQISIPSENIFRIKGEKAPSIASLSYAKEIEMFFSGKEKRFDLILLGLGADGHIASLFPNTDALNEKKVWVVKNQHPGSKNWRITLTYPTINSARNIMFLVSGSDKASIVSEVILNTSNPPLYPAKKIVADGTLTWHLDEQAAKLIIENTNLEKNQS
jgi:6-phosphogluconolactonase